MKSFGVRRLLLITSIALLVAPSAHVTAQYASSPPGPDSYDQSREWTVDEVPAHLAFVEGSVTLERDGRLEPAEANLALLAGDRLRTRGGRVEILFPDSSAFYVDEDTELDLLSGSLVRLLAGHVRISIPRQSSTLDYRVDAPGATVWIRSAGEYRIDISESRRGQAEVDLTVIRGSAELVNEYGRTLVRPGTHAVATPDLAPSLPYVVNSAAWDDFDRWSDRERAARVGTHSTRYLPTELSYYGGAFDTYGTWDYMPAHGYVWYPRVPVGWRPYYQGRWSFTAHFGWLWIGIDRWSWPTHHYGRWGVSSGAWYWIPDRRWGPAWVSWASAPGYVSWCPLGFDGRAVYGWRHTSPWLAWTVLPSRAFVHNVWVTQHVVVHNTIAPTIRTQFVERRGAPINPTNITRRAPVTAPTYARGTAIPRDGRPAYDGEEAWRRSAAQARTSRGVSSGSGNSVRDSVGGATDVRTPRAVPERSRVAPGGSAAGAARTDSRSETGGERTVPRAQPRSAAETRSNDVERGTVFGSPSRAGRPAGPDNPPDVAPRSRAVPSGQSQRQSDPPVERPSYGGGARSREVPRAEPPRAEPPAPRPSYGGTSRSREVPRAEPPAERPSSGGGARSREVPRAEPPRAEPPRQAPPSSGGGGDRGGRTVDRPAPRSAPPPPAAAPPPARGRGGEATRPSSGGGGGGGGESRATPRSRGRGGNQ